MPEMRRSSVHCTGLSVLCRDNVPSEFKVDFFCSDRLCLCKMGRSSYGSSDVRSQADRQAIRAKVCSLDVRSGVDGAVSCVVSEGGKAR